MAEKTGDQIELVLEALPPALHKAPEQMTLGELMQETNRQGLMACLSICRAFDPASDIKERRLIVDITGQVMRANLRIAEEQFKAARDDKIGHLLEQLKKEA